MVNAVYMKVLKIHIRKSLLNRIEEPAVIMHPRVLKNKHLNLVGRE